MITRGEGFRTGSFKSQRVCKILLGLSLAWGLVFSSIAFAQEAQGIDRKVETTEIEIFDGKKAEISVISYDYMEELFDKLANHPRIPFRFPDDGCYARAHKMSILLEQAGIITVKSFVIGDLKVETPNHPDGYVEWWYHVAPSVFVKDGQGGKIFMVFDPSIFDMPVTYDEWTGIQTRHQGGGIEQSYKTLRFVYTPASNKYSDLKDYLSQDLVDMEVTLDLFKEMEHTRHNSGVSNEDYLM